MVMWAKRANKTVQNFLNAYPYLHNYLEIGSHTGESLKIIAERFPEKTIYGIDPFISDGIHLGIERGKALSDARDESKINLSCLKNVKMFEMTSKEFLTIHEDSLPSLDVSVVFIDGSHIYDDILTDIEVSIGCIDSKSGVVIFDDIDMASVQDAMIYLTHAYGNRVLRIDDNGGAMTFIIKEA